MRDVFPVNPTNDLANASRSDAKRACDGAARFASIRSLADDRYVGLGELRFGIAATVRAGAAALRAHIAHVVGVRTQKQMSRVYTRRIIAAMENIFIQWRRFIVGKFPCNAMGIDVSTFHFQSAITSAFCASPQPALGLGVLGNFRPKPLSDGNLFRHLSILAKD